MFIGDVMNDTVGLGGAPTIGSGLASVRGGIAIRNSLWMGTTDQGPVKILSKDATSKVLKFHTEGVTVANNGTVVLNPTTLAGFLELIDGNGWIATFGAYSSLGDGFIDTVVEINDPNNKFSITKDTATMANVYIEAGDLMLQNKRGYALEIFGIFKSKGGD